MDTREYIKAAIRSIDELGKLLDKKGIKYELHREYISEEQIEEYLLVNQIRVWKYPDSDDEQLKYLFFSAICHFGSYGFHQGLIEVYDFNHEPIGHCVPKEAASILIDWFYDLREQERLRGELNDI